MCHVGRTRSSHTTTSRGLRIWRGRWEYIPTVGRTRILLENIYELSGFFRAAIILSTSENGNPTSSSLALEFGVARKSCIIRRLLLGIQGWG